MLCLLQTSNGIRTNHDTYLYPIKPLKAVLSPDGAHILTIEQHYTSVEVNTYNTTTHLRRTLVRYPCQPLYTDIKVYKNDCMVRINSWLIHLVEFKVCRMTTCVCKRFWKSFTAAKNKEIGLFDIYRYPTTHRFQVDAFYKKPQTFKRFLSVYRHIFTGFKIIWWLSTDKTNCFGSLTALLKPSNYQRINRLLLYTSSPTKYTLPPTRVCTSSTVTSTFKRCRISNTRSRYSTTGFALPPRYIQYQKRNICHQGYT